MFLIHLAARALVNLKEMAAQPDLVAVFGGRFSSPWLAHLDHQGDMK